MKNIRPLGIALFALAVGCGRPPARVAVQTPPPPEEEPAPTVIVLPGTNNNPTPPAVKPKPVVKGVATLEDTNTDPHIVEVSLTAQVKYVTFPGKGTAQMYTYNGQFPGPLLEAHQGDRVIVHFTNELPEPTTIHWHGLRISDQMDGSPRIQSPVPFGGTFTYDFVVPDAGSFWYHPHVRANEQIEKGLYGPIVIRGDDDPEYDVERYILLDDILLDGGTFYPFMEGHMEGMHGRMGNMLLTNGLPSGSVATEQVTAGHVERWRLLNTSNARTMELTMYGPSVRIIATDGGLLKEPYTLNNSRRLILPVGQRYDLEVTYRDAGASAQLQSWVLMQGSSGGAYEGAINVFNVQQSSDAVEPRTIAWPAIQTPSRAADESVTLQFDAMEDTDGMLMWMINDQPHGMDPLFTFAKGRTVKMQLDNLTGMEHPFHLHGQFFEVLDNGSGARLPGLRDTVLVGGGETIEILAYMDNPGRWMAHCHILEHAALGMMAEIVVAQ